MNTVSFYFCCRRSRKTTQNICKL